MYRPPYLVRLRLVVFDQVECDIDVEFERLQARNSLRRLEHDLAQGACAGMFAIFLNTRAAHQNTLVGFGTDVYHVERLSEMKASPFTFHVVHSRGFLHH